MVSRTAPGGGTRLFVSLLVMALVVSVVQYVAVEPAQATSGDLGPTMVPGASTAGLQDEDGQWDTKNQHRSWFVEGRWDAILPMAAPPASAESAWWIVQEAIPEALGNAPVPKVEVSTGPTDRPDIFWDDPNNRLYILMSGSNTTSLYVYDYDDGTDTYTFSHGSDITDFEAANSRAGIFRDSNGDLWASKMDGGGLLVARSEDDGVSWSTPANLIFPVGEGQTQITQVGNVLALAAAEDGDPGNESGRYSKYLFYTLDLANAANFDAGTFGSGTLTMFVLPLAGETVTIGSKTYRWVTGPLTGANLANDVVIGASVTESRTNLRAAINGGATAGVTYDIDTLPNPDAFAGAVAGANIPLSANASGTEGNVTTTETMSDPGSAFGAATLMGGASPWAREEVPLAQGSNPFTIAVVHADDELSMVKDSSNNIYIATETQRTSFENTNHALDPQVILYKRTPAGAWTQFNVKMDQMSSNGDRKRPVVAILDVNIYIFTIDNPRTTSGYWTKPLATLTGTWGSPIPLFNTPFEAYRNNIAPRDPVTTAQRLPILIDWANEDPSEDSTIWQQSLPRASTNQAPGAYAGVDSTVAASPATNLGGVIANDGLGGPVGWSWSQVSGPGIANFVNGSGSCATSQCLLTTTATYTALGTYVLRLTANEAAPNPLTNFDEVTITVNSLQNTPPVLTVTKPTNGTTVAAGGLVTFQATANDPPDGDISADIVWTSSRDGVIGLGGLFTKTNLTIGVHTIRATISDGQNTVQSGPISVTVTSGGGPPPPPPPDPNNPFIDDDGNIFEDAIEWMRAEGITLGCNPPTNNRFCPNDRVTRGQMAAFLVRALDYTAGGNTNYFVDDNGHVFETSINRLRAAQVTLGCNPPTNNRYCPNDFVTRGQMAAFLVRALGYTAGGNTNYFIDDNGHVFENSINRLRAAGVTLGCNPPANNRYCPNDYVTRGQMAAFLKRALGG